MILRYLISINLLYANKTKTSNGTYLNEYVVVKPYKVLKQELYDEISSNIYGANINQMYRLSSPNRQLEKFLQKKINNSTDNISKYFICIENVKYKIKNVKDNWVDIERL